MSLEAKRWRIVDGVWYLTCCIPDIFQCGVVKYAVSFKLHTTEAFHGAGDGEGLLREEEIDDGYFVKEKEDCDKGDEGETIQGHGHTILGSKCDGLVAGLGRSFDM